MNEKLRAEWVRLKAKPSGQALTTLAGEVALLAYLIDGTSLLAVLMQDVEGQVYHGYALNIIDGSIQAMVTGMHNRQVKSLLMDSIERTINATETE